MLTYSEQEVIVPSDEIAAWVMTNISPSSAFEFPRIKTIDDGFSPFNHLGSHLGVPVRVNVLYYPWGASRWAHCFILVDDTTLQTLRNAAYANNVYQSLELLFDDEDGDEVDDTRETVATNMWMLPPVPMAKFNLTDAALQAITNQMWLVPLVDDRYWWWERSAVIAVTEGTTTWLDLYTAIGVGLGVSIAVDTIPAAYLMPGATFRQSQKYLPILLDDVAASVGQRIIRNLDGTVQAISATTGLALQAATVATAYAKEAGGVLLFGVDDNA